MGRFQAGWFPAGAVPSCCASPAGPGIAPLPRALLLLPVPHPAWDAAGMGTGPGCGAGTERGAQGPSQELCFHLSLTSFF